MSFTDWLDLARRSFRERPPRDAARITASEFVTGAAQRLGRRVNFGERVWDREWDVLIILDACRYDLWQAVAPEFEFTDPNPEAMYSCASHSREWCEKHFTDKYTDEMARTGLISANLFTCNTTDVNKWAHLDELWRQEFDEEVGQTPPEAVRDAAIAFWRERRRAVHADQMIVWFMQPHIPFLKAKWSHGYEAAIREDGTRAIKGKRTEWHQLRDGDLDHEAVWEAYSENLRLILRHVDRLRQNLEAEHVVVTADHGNAMGEGLMYGHEPYVLSRAMKRVPWVPIPARDEETIMPSYRPPDREDLSDDEMEERLAALGYV
jgi:hypothetical protein